MARKPRTAKASASSKSKARAPSDRIIDAALDEAAAVGWRTLTLAAVAERAKLELGEVLTFAPTKPSLLARILDLVDDATLASVKTPDPRDKTRDRLFDVVMRRFDALNRHRAGMRAMIVGAMRDPVTLVMAGLRLKRSLRAMMAAADIS